MKKNGFTLIELLAVIVILAIIALIATPIILGIINDARKESQERSAELYLSAVDLAVVKRNMTEGFTPEECTITEGIVNCTGYEEPLKVEIDGETPISGTIKFENNKATMGTILTFKDFTATLAEEGKIVIGEIENSVGTFEIGKLSSVCEPAETQYFEDTPMEPGYEYNCKVDPNAEPYTFYVLNKTDNQINLIMDRNIISEEGMGWLSTDVYTEITKQECYRDDYFCFPDAFWELGPIIPMRKLVEATSTWTNLNSMTINTFDNQGNISNLAESYTSYARLPKASELNDYNPETQEYTYLYDHMHTIFCVEDPLGDCNNPYGIEKDYNASAYMTQSIGSSDIICAFADAASIIGFTNRDYYMIGIRPVITLDI